MGKKKVNPDEPVLGTAAAGDPHNPEAGADTDRFTEPVTNNEDAYDGADAKDAEKTSSTSGEDEAK